MPERRVVITGMGVVTPVGNSIETFWSNLKNGVSGIRTIDAFDTTGYDCKIGGQVRDFDPKAFFKNPKDVRRTDRFTHLAVAAAKMAVADSGIDIVNLKERDRFGVIVSTGIGGLKTLQDQLQVLLTKGPGRNSPFTIPMLISNMAGGGLAASSRWSSTCAAQTSVSLPLALHRTTPSVNLGESSSLATQISFSLGAPKHPLLKSASQDFQP